MLCMLFYHKNYFKHLLFTFKYTIDLINKFFILMYDTIE